MQALDFESFETRASFFNRSLEQELISCLDGDRRGEARSQLERIAIQRATTIEALIQNELNRNITIIYYPNTMHEKTPSKVFHITECSICSSDDSNKFGVLACGHVICKDCFQDMKKFPTLCHGNAVKCPECRNPSNNIYDYDECNKIADNESNQISSIKDIEKDESSQKQSTKSKNCFTEKMKNYGISIFKCIKL